MSNAHNSKLEIFGKPIEKVNEYTYLGQIMAFNDRSNKILEVRIKKAWRNFWALKQFYKSKKLSVTAKTKILETCTIPALLYGAQTWTLTKRQIKKLQATQRRMERSILNLKLKDKVSIKKIRQKTKLKDVGYLAKKLKFKFIGHTYRASDNRWSRTLLEWWPYEHKRERGRPHTRFIDEIKNRVGKAWRRVTEDRVRWRKTGEVYARLWAV